MSKFYTAKHIRTGFEKTVNESDKIALSEHAATKGKYKFIPIDAAEVTQVISSKLNETTPKKPTESKKYKAKNNPENDKNE